jgi:WD40 repeat protein
MQISGNFLFFSVYGGTLRQYCLCHGEMLKNWHKLHGASITQIWATLEFVISGDADGYLIQVCPIHFTKTKDYGKVHGSAITSIDGDPHGDYFFTADKSGHVIQFCLKTQRKIRKFDAITNGGGIRALHVIQHQDHEKNVSNIHQTALNHNTYCMSEPNLCVVILSEDNNLYISGNLISNFINEYDGTWLSYKNDMLDPQG